MSFGSLEGLMKRVVVVVAAVVGAAWAAGGCGSSAPSPTGPNGSLVAVSSKSCVRAHPNVGPTRASLDRQGSAVALAKLGDRSIAYVADSDSKSLHTIDV